MKLQWTIPEEKILTVECRFCGETGDLTWAEKHLKEKKYYKSLKTRGWQFTVIELKSQPHLHPEMQRRVWNLG